MPCLAHSNQPCRPVRTALCWQPRITLGHAAPQLCSSHRSTARLLEHKVPHRSLSSKGQAPVFCLPRSPDSVAVKFPIKSLCPGPASAHTHWGTPACLGVWQKQVHVGDLHSKSKAVSTSVTSLLCVCLSLSTACSSTIVTLGVACAIPLTPVFAAGKSWAQGSWEDMQWGALHPPNS